ncbi:unnamed protein product [Brassica oleracea var. botrytis]
MKISVGKGLFVSIISRKVVWSETGTAVSDLEYTELKNPSFSKMLNQRGLRTKFQ